MIPILYRSDEINFTSNGIGRLTECISCTVTEERNGVYECEFQYPITGRFYEEMVENGGIIAVTHDDHRDVQPFDIYKFSAPIDGVVTFYASHISYRLNNIILRPFTAPSCAAALAAFKTQAANTNPFTFGTDKNVSSTFTLDHPANVRSLLAGQQGSILDVYGTGEYEFDKWSVYLHTNRGTNTGVTIRYGKNLSDITREKDESGTFSAIAPYWTDGTTTVTLPESYVVGGTVPVICYPWTNEDGVEITDGSGEVIYFQSLDVVPFPLDMSSSFESQPTEAELRQAAVRYLNNNEPWQPSDNIRVDFVALWQTPEYEGVASLQRVGLCDTVSVYYPALGVIAEQQEVIKVVYNVLLDVYDSMELGTAKTTLSQAMVGNLPETVQMLTQGLNDRPTESELQTALDHATQLLAGGLGGYVVINTNANGEPQEILIMDTDDINTAVSVIRMNRNGIGFSQHGYNGPYTSAWTIDGVFNADFIGAGTLLATYIRGGTLTLGGLSNTYGVFQILDASGNPTVSGDRTGLTAKSLTASDYIFVDGNATSYFKIPFRGTLGEDDYLELSSSGMVIQLDDTAIRSMQVALASGASTQPVGSTVGEFLIEYISGTTSYKTDLQPAGIDVINATVSGGATVTNQRVQLAPGYFRVWNRSTGKYFTVDLLAATPSVTTDVKVAVGGDLTVTGTKNRAVQTDQYGERLLYCYETPTPLFGDVGEGVIGEAGDVYVFLDPVFAQTVTGRYQVFLQMYGPGEAYVSERRPGCFIVTGTPGLAFGWEIKAKQRDYDQRRLEKTEEPVDISTADFGELAADYLFKLREERSA